MFRNLNIRNRMLVLILGINLFTLMIIFLVYFNFSRKLIVNETKTKAMEKVKSVANRVEGYLNEKARIGWTFSQNPIFLDWMEKNDQRIVSRKDDPVYSMLIDYSIDLVNKDGDISNVFFASEKTQMNYNQTEIYPSDDYFVGNRPWYQEAVKIGKPSFSVGVDLTDNNIYIAYEHPIYNKEKTLLGISGIDISLQKFTKFMSDLDDVFETGQAFLVGNDGMILSHPDEAYVLKKKLTDFPDDGNLYSNINAFSEKLLESGSGIEEVVFDGDNRYFIYTSISDISWTLVLSVAKSEINAPLRKLVDQSILIFVITFMFLIIAVVIITGSISRPIKQIVEMIRDVAEGEGDLTKRITVDTKDETGELARWFNKFLDNIHDIVKNVVSNAEDVVKASNIISTTSDKMDQGAQEQANRTANIASSAKEMTNTINEVNQIYNQAVNIVKQAAEKAESGREIVNKSVEGMSKISETVENSQLTIEELGTRSAEIGKIIRVIDEIANQTNLLALNAAIEASGAGEHGRGFAVVAEDIRQLADRTTQATKEISVMIKSIQDDTRKAVKSMQEGNADLEAGTELVNNSGAVLKDIVKTVDEVQRVISEMANASEQLTLAADEIAINIGDISTVTSRTTDNTREFSVISTQLNNQAEELRILVKRFKIK